MYNYDSKLVDSSRLVADMLVKDIGNEDSKFHEMLTIALLDEYPISMRAARVIALCTEQNPKLMESYISQLIYSLGTLRIDGVKRSFLKIIAETTIIPDEESIGILTDLAFTWLDDTKQAIAIRYYCVDILLKVSNLYPEIGDELQILLKNLLEGESPGLKSKSKKVLNYLRTKKN
jgi:hypothetical protein